MSKHRLVAEAATIQSSEITAPTARSLLLRLGELRDGVLFVATSVYVLGYATWALYAASRDFGMLPPLEGQYFLTGILPFAMCVVALVSLRASLFPSEEKRSKAAASAVVVILLASLLVSSATIADHRETTKPLFYGLVSLAGLLLMVTGFILLIRAGVAPSRARARNIRVLSAAACATVIWAYADVVFPYIPSELGGPAPRCVALDVLESTLSDSTLMKLGIARSTDSTGVSRSLPVWLRFEGGGRVLISGVLADSGRLVLRLRDVSVSATTPASACVTLPNGYG